LYKKILLPFFLVLLAALVDGKLELPNDISGVVYISLDEASAWQLHLAKEMKQSGYDIDMNKLFF
jgi:predicted nucleotide-binding protein